jgi:hypothetical protein
METSMSDSNTTTERDAYWAALTEIAFGNFDIGPTPDYIREHARRALKMKPFPVCQEIEQ